MVKELSISEARRRLPSLVEEVASSKDEIVITRRGEPLARIVPLAKPKRSRKYPLRGMKIWISDDFDEPMDDLWEALAE
jgi:prevent-host-death family protein